MDHGELDAYLDQVLVGGRERRKVGIVDLLVTVDDPDDDEVIVPALESAGYELRVREPGSSSTESLPSATGAT
jgi:hypothetical protein